MNTFSAQECIRFGWETFKRRPWLFAGVMLLTAVLSGIAAGIASAFGSQGGGQAIGSIINFAIGTLISMGVTAFFLKAHDTPDTVESTELWHPQPFLKYLATRLLLALLVGLGLILLVVPGIILSLMFMLSGYIVIERGLGPIEAMKESKRITTGYKWTLLKLSILLGLLNILGLLCLIVGLLVTVPVTYLAITHAYRTLSRVAPVAA